MRNLWPCSYFEIVTRGRGLHVVIKLNIINLWLKFGRVEKKFSDSCKNYFAEDPSPPTYAPLELSGSWKLVTLSHVIHDVNGRGYSLSCKCVKVNNNHIIYQSSESVKLKKGNFFFVFFPNFERVTCCNSLLPIFLHKYKTVANTCSIPLELYLPFFNITKH